MMKAVWLAKRNSKEILRDPLSLVLGVLLPVFFIVLLINFKPMEFKVTP